MKRTIIGAAALAVALAGPAKATDDRVFCYRSWVSFVPYAPGTVNSSGVRFYTRKADIRQGRLVGAGVGFLLVQKGAGWDQTNDELKVPEQTFLHVMACLGGPASG